MMEECFWKEGDHNAGRGMIQYINMAGWGSRSRSCQLGKGGTRERERTRGTNPETKK